jgi:phosphoribosylformylglycinamidine synthase I
MVNTCVLTGYGINADRELEEAFILAGSETERIHLEDLIANPSILDNFQILAVPGGFSFGDHLSSGLVFASMVKEHLTPAIEKFKADGKLIIGICNGFQVLVKLGILPGRRKEPEVSLVHNDSGIFQDSWIQATINSESPCVWTQGLSELDLPIRHGEGKFVSGTEEALDSLERENLIVVRYQGENPNGSQRDIAGICDPSGKVFGLMPHPEAWIHATQHPQWRRRKLRGDGAGLQFFKNGVEAAKKLL